MTTGKPEPILHELREALAYLDRVIREHKGRQVELRSVYAQREAILNTLTMHELSKPIVVRLEDGQVIAGMEEQG